MVNGIDTIELSDSTVRNFPIKSFYSEHIKKDPKNKDKTEIVRECYTFYRQGHCFTMSAQNQKAVKLERITHEAELGPMYLLYDQALVT